MGLSQAKCHRRLLLARTSKMKCTTTMGTATMTFTKPCPSWIEIDRTSQIEPLNQRAPTLQGQKKSPDRCRTHHWVSDWWKTSVSRSRWSTALGKNHASCRRPRNSCSSLRRVRSTRVSVRQPISQAWRSKAARKAARVCWPFRAIGLTRWHWHRLLRSTNIYSSTQLVPMCCPSRRKQS